MSRLMPRLPVLFVVVLACVPCAQAQIDAPTSIQGADSRIYKAVGDTQLRLHIFRPPGAQAKPAIVFFFGGGWIGGSVTQYVSRCEYLSARGMVAVVADYRVRSRHGVGAFECVADAKSAIRWLRMHAREFGIDEQRIVAAGGSSGGHLAASTALIDGFDEPNEDLAVSSVPNALVLLNPGLDLPALFAAIGEEKAIAQFGDWVTRCEHISPMTHVRPGAPPTIIFHGTADAAVPFEHAQRFAEAMRAQGNRCELVAYDGRSHGFSLFEEGDGSDFSDTLRRTDEFLISLGYLTGEPAADTFTRTKRMDRFFDSDGVKIRYIDVGPRDGEPVVLVPGGAQSIEDAWVATGVMNALDDDYRVIGLDCRGLGRSDKPHDPQAYGNAMVDDVIGLLDHLAIDKAHIVGYSLGGRVVGKLVADHPDRVISALPCGTTLEPPSDAEREEFERYAIALEETGSIRPLIERFNTDGVLTEAQLDEADEAFRATNDTKAIAAMLRSMDDLLPDRAKLEANSVPCRSIVGAGDMNLALTRTTATYMANLEIHAPQSSRSSPNTRRAKIGSLTRPA